MHIKPFLFIINSFILSHLFLSIFNTSPILSDADNESITYPPSSLVKYNIALVANKSA